MPERQESPEIGQTSRTHDGLSRRATVVLSVLFAAIAGVVLFYELGDCRTLGSHEGYATVPAREMMESGNWITPRFGGIPRLTKPPLAYWIIATMGTIYGELNEWIVRLPAAVCALLLSLLMGHWATQWYGRTAGWAAAFVQLTSIYMLIYCRKAEIDMLVWLGVSAALYLIANQPAAESRSRNFLRWTAVFAMMSICWMAKFHYGPTMIIAALGVYFLIQKRWTALWNFFNPVGLALLVAAIVIWPWMVLQEIPQAGDVWQRETVGRATGDLGHRPLWYYGPIVLWFTLPWTFFVAAAVPASWRRAWKQQDARERFLWVWFLTHFVIVSLQPNKHVHYVISALPVATMLAAQQMAAVVGRIQAGRKYLSQRQAVGISVVAMAGVTVGAIVASLHWPYLATPVIATGVVIGVGVCAVVWLLRFQRLPGAGVAVTATFLLSFVIIHSGIVPQRDHRLGTALFARESRLQLGTDVPVIAYKLGQSPIVYYLDSPVVRIEKKQMLEQRVQRDGRVFILAEKPDAHRFSEFGQVRIVSRMQHRDDIPDPKHPLLVLVELQSPQFAARKRTIETAAQSERTKTTVQ